ncbi:MAG: deoxyribodipyrimidine photo-lyase, partial [Solirubrobacterales bacterium]
LLARGIRMIVRAQSPTVCVPDLAQEACSVVVDAGHMRIQKQWREDVGRALECDLIEVETNLIVPPEEASDREDFSARTFRMKIRKKLDNYLVELRQRNVRRDSLGVKLDGLDLGDIDRIIADLKIDHSVGGADGFHGGAEEAQRRLDDFLVNRLDSYPTARNDPSLDAQSHLSPYLHFGQISPLHIALQTKRRHSAGEDAFLEELIVRRELSHNFVYHNPRYDSFECLPSWAVRTLNFHSRDKREHVYSLEEFEAAQTHDPYWNAAQREMVLTGKMHGYMRMYWGKKILEWTATPQEAFRIALYLNNRYELDGRDPNGFAGVAWCFGKHDRPWAERPIFGMVRYMNASGLQRKFDVDAYVERVKRVGART